MAERFKFNDEEENIDEEDLKKESKKEKKWTF